MSMWAAIKAARVVDLATHVVAIELLAASQGLDLLAPLQTSEALGRVHKTIRQRVEKIEADRPPAPDIAAIAQEISSGALARACSLPLE
jgi:histidine ammonia-lyase